MARRQLEVVSISLVRLSWLVTIICCALPFWRGTKVSEEIIIWEGLWDMCEAQGLEILQCVKYSHITLPRDIQVSRVLVVTCIILTWLGLVLDRYRGDSTCVSNPSTREKMTVVTSVLFLGLGVLLLVSVSWVTHNVIHGNSLSLSLMETMMGGWESHSTWAGSALCCICWEGPTCGTRPQLTMTSPVLQRAPPTTCPVLLRAPGMGPPQRTMPKVGYSLHFGFICSPLRPTTCDLFSSCFSLTETSLARGKEKQEATGLECPPQPQ